MRRLFVAQGRLVVTIRFDEHEARRVVFFLDDVEPKHTGLGEARAGVLQSGGFEVLHELGFDLDLDVHDEHVRFYPEARAPSSQASAANSSVKIATSIPSSRPMRET